MAREATLFEQSGGSVIEAFLMLKSAGSANIPPMWIERAKESRKHRESKLALVLTGGTIRDILTLRDWELTYKKECFYRGIRILLELERDGKSLL